jgi:hypothetical protein
MQLTYAPKLRKAGNVSLRTNVSHNMHGRISRPKFRLQVNLQPFTNLKKQASVLTKLSLFPKLINKIILGLESYAKCIVS